MNREDWVQWKLGAGFPAVPVQTARLFTSLGKYVSAQSCCFKCLLCTLLFLSASITCIS